jgi:hypothetical protein
VLNGNAPRLLARGGPEISTRRRIFNWTLIICLGSTTQPDWESKEKRMQKRQRLFTLISVFALLAGSAFAQEGGNRRRSAAAGSSPEAGRAPAAGREIQLTDLLARRDRRRQASSDASLQHYADGGGPNPLVLGGGTSGG